MKKYLFTAIALVIAIVGVSTSALAQDSASEGDVSYRLITPRSGEVLRAGQTVQITWELALPKAMTQHPYGEMEFFVDTVEGYHARISPQLSLTARTFTWTVPPVSSRAAKLTLQCGIEGEGDQYRFVQIGSFVIKQSLRAPVITLNAMPETMRAGQNLEISWASNLEGDRTYDVMVSYDRGAHFYKAGSTTETRYTLPVDEDFAGSIVVQIVNRGADGTKVTTPVNRGATVRVSD